MSWRRGAFLTFLFGSTIWVTIVVAIFFIRISLVFTLPQNDSAVIYFPAEDRVHAGGIGPLSECPNSAPLRYDQPLGTPNPDDSSGQVFKHIAATLLVTCEPANTARQWILSFSSEQEIADGMAHIEALVLDLPPVKAYDLLLIFDIGKLYLLVAAIPPAILYVIGLALAQTINREWNRYRED